MNKNWLINDIIKQPSLVICGKSRSGKSYLIKYIMQNVLKHNHMEFGLVFSLSSFKHEYDFLPEKYIFTSYDENVLKKYLTKLENIAKKGQEIPNFLIFDDVSNMLKKSKVFHKFVSIFRKYNTWVFISCQYLSDGCNTVSREQVDFMIIFKNNSFQAIETAFKAIGQSFDSVIDFKHFLQENIKEKYQALVYNPNSEDEKMIWAPFTAPEKYKEQNLKFKY